MKIVYIVGLDSSSDVVLKKPFCKSNDFCMQTVMNIAFRLLEVE